MRRDPVCKMKVNEVNAFITECNGETYYFCSEGCREKFLKDRSCATPRTEYDLIIIGGGPAGLTAAVYAATLKVEAFLLTRDLGGQAVDSTKIENYMGFDFITGPELTEKFRYQLINSHYIDHLLSDTEKIESADGGFYVTTSDLKRYFAKTIIVATGMTRKRLNVEGEEKFQRKGLFYGNIQDLSFVHGADVAVVGGGNSALQIVENLHTISKNIYLIADTGLSGDAAIVERVCRFDNLIRYEGFKVSGFTGSDTLSGIEIRKIAEKETISLPVKGVFIAIGLQPNSSLVANLLHCNERGEIIINSDCSTSFPGIFAAGDVTNAFGKRIIIASGEGAKAALAARQYLLHAKKSMAPLYEKKETH